MSETPDNPGAAKSEPSSDAPTLESLRRNASHARWRVYETAREILADLDGRIGWKKLYEEDLGLAELVSWGLFLEEAVPQAMQRLRGVLDEPVPDGALPEPRPEELEDHLFWGTKQIEQSIQQPLSVLSRNMVSSITGEGEADSGNDLLQKKRSLAIPIAEVAGKTRSEVRKFTAFLVAGDDRNPGNVELVLFPGRTEELGKGLYLKRKLVETMESFQGSEIRMSIADVLRLWREGRVLGQAALAEVDVFLANLRTILDRDNRRALYVDSFYRLADWNEHLAACREGLSEYLGDDKVEDTLTKEIAAILDTEILAGILGKEHLKGFVWSSDLPELIRLFSRRAIDKLELKRAQRQRLVELKELIEEALTHDEPAVLEDADERLLFDAAAKLKGKRLVDQLRIPGSLPESLGHMAHLQPIVLESEDGLKTYLMLLYGQIQNRDLHLVSDEAKEIPLAEKRLALDELEYRLARLRDSDRYRRFRAVRRRLAEIDEGRVEGISATEWEELYDFFEHLVLVLTPRLERIAAFEDIEGLTLDTTVELRAVCEQLLEIGEGPSADELETVGGLLDMLALLLESLDDISLVTAPPETVSEIEDFLDMMG